MKKFYLKILQLDSDARKLIKNNDTEKAKNDFINYGMKEIHKKFLLDKSLEIFLEKSENIFFQTNSNEDHLQNLEWLDKKYQVFSTFLTTID